ncbi:MAG: RnfABCDGE type electron transport complex subunit A [Candidatus Omnitrophota bacterium]|nr:MAG: RnfABCDGE type electron transport complex subunit A [Candidatus Omnitrophota bacterium]
MDLGLLLSIVIGNIFISNFILFKFLGLCPFIGVSRKTGPALSMGAAVIFVMTLSSIITWCIYNFLLLPFNMEFLRTISFILVIASFVQLAEMIILKTNPTLYRVLGVYLPLITTNCAILGVTVLNIDMFFKEGKALSFSFFYAVLQGFCAGLGFLLAMLLMSGIRERLDILDVPDSLKGIPLAFIVASLMSLAFMGFSGFKF